MHGRCTCGEIRYKLLDRPLITHACHCTWCQRETGTAFAVNAMIETDLLDIRGTPVLQVIPSHSGKGQEVARCPTCGVTLFSHYAGLGRLAAFVRVGTLDTPALCPPDAHIFTATRQPWLVLDSAVPAFEVFYDRNALWPTWALRRRDALVSRQR